MSSPILPMRGPAAPSRVTPPADSSAEDIGAFISDLVAGRTPLALAASRGGPPPDVLDQIAAAGRIEERLRQDGHQLRFSPTARGGRTTIEIHDREGNAVRTLSTAEALDLAAGKPLE